VNPEHFCKTVVTELEQDTLDNEKNFYWNLELSKQ